MNYLNTLACINVCILVLQNANIAMSQSIHNSDSCKVLALKGDIFFEGHSLKKNEFIRFKKNDPISQLNFGSLSDWLKALDLSEKKIYNFYPQKRNQCQGCLGTKSSRSIINNEIDLLRYFNQRYIYLINPDTLICNNLSSGWDTSIVPIFQLYIKGRKYNRIMGNKDTIIISQKNLLKASKLENKYQNTFLVDSIKFFYYKTSRPEQQILLDIPSFCIYFLDDAIIFLKGMGLTNDEIVQEICENYIELIKQHTLKNTKDARFWLKNIIQNQNN